MASPTQWTWVWVNSGSWWWTGRPGMLQFIGSQRVRHDWATELNWTRMVMTFPPRSKRLLISWLQSPSAVILEPPQIKSATVSIVFPSICYEVMGPDAMIFIFSMLSFKPTFSLSSCTLIKRLFIYSSVQFSSVAQSCSTLCDPMNCSTPGLLVHQQLPEFTQIHVHWVGDAI